MLFLSQLINGLQLGSIYALVALGYSMVYGIIMLLNFAHGDIIMMGGYFALVSLAASSNPVLAVIATVVGCVVLAVVIEKVAYKPLRQAPRISLLITAIGVSLLLQNLAQLIWTANTRAFPSTMIIPAVTFNLGALSISLNVIVTIVVAVISMVLLAFIVQKTKMGKAMRAVSEDTEAAQLMGINVNNTITYTFIIGSALAGIGSILYCCRYPIVNPTMGSLLGLKAFVAAVFGGIGSIPGAVIGAFIIGICENIIKGLGWTTFSDAFTFALLIIILIVKPTGLFGEKANEKV